MGEGEGVFHPSSGSPEVDVEETVILMNPPNTRTVWNFTPTQRVEVEDMRMSSISMANI